MVVQPSLLSLLGLPHRPVLTVTFTLAPCSPFLLPVSGTDCSQRVGVQSSTFSLSLAGFT